LPALKVGGKMFACMAVHKSAEPNSLAIRAGSEQRDGLLSADPDTYYVTDHYLDYPMVLVRLARVHRDALPDLLRLAHRFVTAKSQRRTSVQRHDRDRLDNWSELVSSGLSNGACADGNRGFPTVPVDDVGRREALLPRLGYCYNTHAEERMGAHPEERVGVWRGTGSNRWKNRFRGQSRGNDHWIGWRVRCGKRAWTG
jgi:hypothetical protein